MADNELQQAIELIKAGDKSKSVPILTGLIKQNPRNEKAWLWLSTCYDDFEKKRFCLTKALEINPDNENAKQALKQFTPPPEPKLVEPVLSQVEPKRVQIFQIEKRSTIYQKAKTKNPVFSPVQLVILGTIGIITIVSIIIFAFFILQREKTISVLLESATPSSAIAIQPTVTIIPILTILPTFTIPPTLIPLTDIDIDKALITKDSLSFGGLFKPYQWVECGSGESTYLSWAGEDPIGVVKKKRKYFGKSSSCGGDFSIEERIYISSSPRQAARAAEGLHQQISDWVNTVCCTYETKLINDDQISIWLLRGDISFEESYVVIQFDEAVIYLRVTSSQKLVEADLTDLALEAVKHIRSAQNP